ncbi:hypothetical protein EAb13_CDS0069 [Acinetobacter phage EAb13]|nr:hypothetical protein EAb13_CDS0069 [Acinetobacter phage EAb13]
MVEFGSISVVNERNSPYPCMVKTAFNSLWIET